MIRSLHATTNADNLLALRERLYNRRYESEILNLRLDYVEQAQVLSHYLGHVFWVDSLGRPSGDQPERVFPHFLPTQASGRWSVTNPPLPNYPPDIRKVIKPDDDWPWICWDLDAIEAKIVAAFSHDRDDLDAFNNGYDIHTITACRMTGVELPPDLKDPHRSPECAEWRAKLKWEGKDDKRRILAKVRYCLLYGKSWQAVQGSTYERSMVKQGFPREDLVKAAKQFLASKPNLVSTKLKWWDICAKTKESRTIFGRRRKLFGDKWARAKEGWNHMVQGSVSEMLNIALIETCQEPCTLVYPSHDAGKVAVPKWMLLDNEEAWPTINIRARYPEHRTPREMTIKRFKDAIERPYEIEGEKIVSTATMYVLYPNGKEEKI